MLKHGWQAAQRRPLDMGGGQMKTPARGQAQPGQESHVEKAADTYILAQASTKLQCLRLRCAHGLTEAQANALALLIWGAGQ
jgi:hypothetical protein